MTDHAPFTDEELANIVEVFREALMVSHAGEWERETISKAAHTCTNALHAMGLIADLRAAWAEVTRQTRRAHVAEAEVERLRNEKKELQAEVDSLEKWIPNGW